jgi:tetratricopeptide (TPR) repeat protein
MALLLGTTLGATTTGEAQRSKRDVERAKQLFQDGMAFYEQGQLKAAVDSWLEAHRAMPSNELSFNIARAYERMSVVPNAVKWFRQYLAQAKPAPRERKDIEQRIEVLQSVQRRQENQIFAAPPSTSDLTTESRRFFLRGVGFFKKKQYEAALQSFMAAHRFSAVPEVLFNIAVTSERLDRAEEAADFYREYARTQRDPAERARIEAKIRELRRR